MAYLFGELFNDICWQDANSTWNIFSRSFWVSHSKDFERLYQSDYYQSLPNIMLWDSMLWTVFWLSMRIIFDYFVTNIAVYARKLKKTKLMTHERIKPSPSSLAVIEAYIDRCWRAKILKHGRHRKAIDQFDAEFDQKAELKSLITLIGLSMPDKSRSEVKCLVKSWLYASKQDYIRALKIKKFNEAAWRLVLYTVLVIYGFYVVIRHGILLNPEAIWKGWANHRVDTWIRVYYMSSLGSYFQMLILIGFDIKRKDFAEMVIHHVITIALISLSWMNNYMYIGIIVLLVHDISDVFLEFGKLVNYSGFRQLAESIFVVFAIVFIVSRCVVYPFYIVFNSLYWSAIHLCIFPAYWIFHGLLLMLEVLHILWSKIIINMAIKKYYHGLEVKGDDRSDNDSDMELPSLPTTPLQASMQYQANLCYRNAPKKIHS